MDRYSLAVFDIHAGWCSCTVKVEYKLLAPIAILWSSIQLHNNCPFLWSRHQNQSAGGNVHIIVPKGIFSSNAYLIYWSLTFWSKLLTWMIFIGYFVMKMWSFIYLWLFGASRRPFKVSKIWKTQYQNACNWESFGWLFQYARQIGMENQIISISWDRNEARA